MTPVMTTFITNAMPVNLRTVPEWRRFAREGLGIESWEAAARRWADMRGGSYVERADGSLIVFTKLTTGKVRKTTYKPGTWRWERA